MQLSIIIVKESRSWRNPHNCSLLLLLHAISRNFLWQNGKGCACSRAFLTTKRAKGELCILFYCFFAVFIAFTVFLYFYSSRLLILLMRINRTLHSTAECCFAYNYMAALWGRPCKIPWILFPGNIFACKTLYLKL